MTIHDICEQARHTSCSCGAAADQPCTCHATGVHLSRVAHARRAGLIDDRDFASVIADQDVFSGSTVLLDPDGAA